MAIFARFIGIDKHANDHIRDLTGARRDATALWALFCDTMPDIKAELIVDANATMERIRWALDETLGIAGPEDTVILSFAGHGTHDHRLVVHNMVFEGLDGSTIPMGEKNLSLCIFYFPLSFSKKGAIFESRERL